MLVAQAVDPDGEGRAARFHVSREYAIDPLEILFVREVMRPEVVVLPGEMPIAGAAELMLATARARAQRLYPVTNGRGDWSASRRRSDIEAARPSSAPLAAIARAPIVALADEPVRAAIHRMAETGSRACRSSTAPSRRSWSGWSR